MIDLQQYYGFTFLIVFQNGLVTKIQNTSEYLALPSVHHAEVKPSQDKDLGRRSLILHLALCSYSRQDLLCLCWEMAFLNIMTMARLLSHPAIIVLMTIKKPYFWSFKRTLNFSPKAMNYWQKRSSFNEFKDFLVSLSFPLSLSLSHFCQLTSDKQGLQGEVIYFIKPNDAARRSRQAFRHIVPSGQTSGQ